MSAPTASTEVKRKEIYTYNAPWPVYGLGWCLKPGAFRFAVGSFIEEYRNKVQVRVCVPRTVAVQRFTAPLQTSDRGAG